MSAPYLAEIFTDELANDAALTALKVSRFRVECLDICLVKLERGLKLPSHANAFGYPIVGNSEAYT